jgi:hypothetical protein
VAVRLHRIKEKLSKAIKNEQDENWRNLEIHG